MTFDNTNRFALFKNDRKRNDKDSDYNGTLNINGVEYWINGWLKDGAKGKFFSGTVKPKDEQPTISQRAQATIRDPISSGRAPLDDDIPFAPEFR